jgi:DNA-binding PadR family transcriptional regulator
MAREQDPLSVEYLLLGIIRKKPIHAYDLDKMLRNVPEFHIVWRFKQSQLYATLNKLERNQLINSTLAAGSAFPFRKVYTTPELGNREFEKWRESPVDYPNLIRSEYMIKVLFLLEEPYPEFERLINIQVRECHHWLDNLAKGSKKDNQKSLYQQVVIEYRRKNIEATIDWLNSCLEMRKGKEGTFPEEGSSL